MRVVNPLRRKRRSPSFSGMLRQLPKMVRLVVSLMADARVAVLDKALFATVLAYVLLPFDFIPDWLGALGLTDDLYLVALTLGRLLRAAGPDILLEHWSGSPKALGFVLESVDRIGSVLPKPIRNALRKVAAR